MKSKRQRLESISKSVTSALKSMKTPASQPFFNPVPIDFQQNLYPTLCHPVSYSISPTYCYQTCVPYITSDINNGHYQNLANEEQLYYEPYITQVPVAIPDTPPIQALEAHVTNYYKNCSQTHLVQTNNSSNVNTAEIFYQPYSQNKEYLIQYEEPAPCQNSNMSQATESVSLETISGQNVKPNSPPSKFNNGKNGGGKFFRPFEN